MIVLDYIFDWILPFLVVLTILVFVHELGHYFVARRCGVRVEVFSIGFGPELFGYSDRAGTRWKLSAVPLGGYVKMFGEHDFATDAEPEAMSEDERRVSFHHRSLRQRTSIVAAGPIANIAFALLMLAAVFASVGEPRPLAGIGTIQDGSAAAEAGFQPGDRVVAIDGAPVRWFDEMREVVRARPGEPLAFDIVRAGETMALTATPQPSQEPGDAGRAVGLLGVKPDMSQVGYERLAPLAAIAAAWDRSYALTTQIMGGLWQIVTGARNTDELGGPLRIAQISGQMAQDGAINLVFFMAALSINLGLINLLPIPMLDGGHLAFYAIEAVRGKPLDKRIQEYGFRFGLIFVLALMILATWNDLLSLNVFGLFE
jgi:regulator of sigma E protease